MGGREVARAPQVLSSRSLGRRRSWGRRGTICKTLSLVTLLIILLVVLLERNKAGGCCKYSSVFGKSNELNDIINILHIDLRLDYMCIKS